MRPLFFFFFSILICHSPAITQNISYDLSSISEPVKKNASVIKRYENIVFEVTDLDRASLQVHKVITVMNEEGKSALSFSVYTSKFETLEEADVKVFDANGKQLYKFKKKDFILMSFGDGLVDDVKTNVLNVSATTYPVTLEFKYEIRFKGILNYPRYQIMVPGEGVEYSSYTAKVPRNLDLRYKEKNISLSPTINDDGKYKYYKWVVNGLAPIAYEEGAVNYWNRYPSIFIAPNRFKMDDYVGDMSSWTKFGLWYGELKKGIDVLSEDRKYILQRNGKGCKR